MLGIMGAMKEEVDLFVSAMTVKKKKKHAGLDYYKGTLEGVDLVIVCGGIGKVSAAVATQILFDIYHVETIIFTGLAGGLVPHLKQGDLVIANYLVQYDVDLTAFGRRVGDIPDIGRMIEADPVMMNTITDIYDSIAAEEKLPHLLVGTIVSGDHFVSDPKKIQWLQREFGGVATEMEGAAVAQVCQMNGKSCTVIRTISDSASDDAADEFKSVLNSVPQYPFRLVRAYLQQLGQSKNESENPDQI